MRFAQCLAASCFAFTLMIALGGGCGPLNRGDEAPQPPAAPATVEQVQRLRERYFTAYPDSRVGVVIATLPDQPFAAIGDVQTADLRENETVTFLNAEGRLLTTGTIVRLLPGQVHVRYAEPSPRGGRAPRVGDVAVLRLPQGARTL